MSQPNNSTPRSTPTLGGHESLPAIALNLPSIGGDDSALPAARDATKQIGAIDIPRRIHLSPEIGIAIVRQIGAQARKGDPAATDAIEKLCMILTPEQQDSAQPVLITENEINDCIDKCRAKHEGIFKRTAYFQGLTKQSPFYNTRDDALKKLESEAKQCTAMFENIVAMGKEVIPHIQATEELRRRRLDKKWFFWK